MAPTRVRSSKLPDVILIRPAYIAKWFKWPSRILPHEHSQPSDEEVRSSMFWRPKGRLLKKVANNWAITRSRTNFAANIDVTDMGANCEGGEQTSLNEKRRFVIDNVTILADSRLPLVRIRGRSSGAFDELAEKANPLRGAWDRT
jgi:hypothetical protein